MKRIGLFLIVLCIFTVFAACGGEPEQTEPPAVPQTVPEETVASLAVESPEAEGFQESDYNVIESTAADGTRMVEYYTRDAAPRLIRWYCEYTNGDISDDYYYPDGSKWYSYWCKADGSSAGVYYDETGSEIKSVHDYSDGEHGERLYYENGNQKSYLAQNSVTGARKEIHCYESGNLKTVISDDPSTGIRSETVYFESGNIRHNKEQGTDYAFEEQFDEEGFLTYYYSKRVGTVVECFTDETGALVKYIENGEIIEDPEALANIARGYKFRN